MVLADSRMVSMTAAVHRDLWVTLLMQPRVMKGVRMAGRMGGDRVKLKGLKVVKIFPEKNYLLIAGSVPGHNGSIVYIQK